jgi:rhodanese-related sulfurtransferase
MGQSLSFGSTPNQPSDEEIQAERRRQEYKIVSPEIVKALARDPSCYWVDVRSEEEVTNRKIGYVSTDKRWVYAPCNEDCCPILEVTAENMIPQKDAKIILYCSSGRRAAIAQQTLEKKGYSNVVNAGGLVDIFYPTKTSAAVSGNNK